MARPHWIRLFLMIFNLVFWLAGAALIIAGAVAKAKANSAGSDSNFLSTVFFTAPGFTIFIGILTWVVSIIGLVGAFKENLCAIITYLVLVGVIIFFLIICSAIGFSLHNNEKFVKTNVESAFKTYENSSASALEINAIQFNLRCCGLITGPDWWNQQFKNDFSLYEVPGSCCNLDKPNNNCSKVFISGTASLPMKYQPNLRKTLLDADVYYQPCLFKVLTIVHSIAAAVGGTCLTFVFLSLFGVAAGSAMVYYIKKGYTYPR